MDGSELVPSGFDITMELWHDASRMMIVRLSVSVHAEMKTGRVSLISLGTSYTYVHYDVNFSHEIG